MGNKEVKNLVYGEIEFDMFISALKWIQREWKDKDPGCWHNAFNVPGGIFVDLGHGIGKRILAAAFTY